MTKDHQQSSSSLILWGWVSRFSFLFQRARKKPVTWAVLVCLWIWVWSTVSGCSWFQLHCMIVRACMRVCLCVTQNKQVFFKQHLTCRGWVEWNTLLLHLLMLLKVKEATLPLPRRKLLFLASAVKSIRGNGIIWGNTRHTLSVSIMGS